MVVGEELHAEVASVARTSIVYTDVEMVVFGSPYVTWHSHRCLEIVGNHVAHLYIVECNGCVDIGTLSLEVEADVASIGGSLDHDGGVAPSLFASERIEVDILQERCLVVGILLESHL